ncbi:hypothetical protein AB0D04_34410 [Streptomyces sp. NPDC048483]|uniref:hypothetical protein n=1 Tax=Streptomyces sp. NPDC048483 TaxID=3154927 RepID=UPI0034255F61
MRSEAQRHQLIIAVVSIITLMTLLATGISTLPTTWACLFGLTSGFGMLLPASTAIILAVGSDAPGAASGMLRSIQFVLGAAAAPLPGVLDSTTAISMAVVVQGARVHRLHAANPGRGRF